MLFNHVWRRKSSSLAFFLHTFASCNFAYPFIFNFSESLLDVSLLYNMLSFALWYLLKNLFLLIGELSPFTCIDMTFAFSSVLLHFLYYFDISLFIDSKTHVSPYFNIYEIKMCLPVDGMLKVN